MLGPSTTEPEIGMQAETGPLSTPLFLIETVEYTDPEPKEVGE